MDMFVVKLLKNKQYPVDIPAGVQVKHGDMVLVLTEKGEEVAQAILVPAHVESILTRKKVTSIPFIRVMTEEDLKLYEEIKMMGIELGLWTDEI